MDHAVKKAFFNEMEKRAFNILRPIKSIFTPLRRGVRTELGRGGAKELKRTTSSVVSNLELPALITAGGIGASAFQPRSIPM
jgi:hypothetical protein